MSAQHAKRAVWAWCFYDWANSAFALTVMASFFPTFFKRFWCIGVDSPVSTSRLGWMNLAAGLAVALLSPLLGAIASAGHARRGFLVFFALLGMAATALLAVFPMGAWVAAAMVFVVARIGFSVANLFYDASLRDVCDDASSDMVSSRGYALGYLGCGILFGINLAMYKHPGLFGLRDSVSAIRASFLLVSVWWFVFSVPLFIFVGQRDSSAVPRKRGLGRIAAQGLSELVRTARDLRQYRGMVLFLVAYWFYIDGVHTIVMMATDFGLSIGLSTGGLMLSLLVVQIVAFPSALLFGVAARRIGTVAVILVAIGGYIVICLVGAWMIRSSTQFMVFAGLTGVFQGAIQALSRSYFTRMVPDGRETEFFGFYNMVGRFAMVLGPGIVAACNMCGHAAGAGREFTARFGVSSIGVLFIVGGLLLVCVSRRASDPGCERV